MNAVETATRLAAGAWRRRWMLAGLLAAALFLVLVGRFWHPFYGFTRLLQFDPAAVEIAIPGIREQPVYVHHGDGGYDGVYYAQLAFHPDLDSPDLPRALESPAYRARRILGPALAWLIAGGREEHIAGTYAALNLGVWLALAGIAWALLRVEDVRSFLAWAGLLFSAGALHSVRLALPDLLAVTAVAAGMWLYERGRSRTALGMLAAAGLVRETALLAIAAAWPGTAWRDWRGLRRFAVAGLLAVLPLAAWWVYVHAQFGSDGAGWGNFGFPLAGWLSKGLDVLGALVEPHHRWLAVTTALAFTGLTVQAFWLCRGRWIGDAWWRVGAAGVVLMACLGTAVWEGHPGAATRVLLPMSLAFAVLVVRRRASLVWVLAGNLTVLAGVGALWTVPHSPRELAAGTMRGVDWVAEMDAGWFGRESHGGHVWSWSAGVGRVHLRTVPAAAGSLQARMSVRALEARTLELRGPGGVVWSGTVGTEWKRIDVPVTIGPDGRGWLEFSSPGPGVRESAAPEAREIAFGVVDLRLER